MKNGVEIIMGDEQCGFSMLLSEVMDEQDENEIEHIVVVDRRRDESGRVIKENHIMDSYIRYEQNEESERYLRELQNETTLPEMNSLSSSFSNQLFQAILSTPITLHQSIRNPYIIPITTNRENVYQNMEQQLNDMETMIRRYMENVENGNTQTQRQERTNTETDEETQNVEVEEVEEIDDDNIETQSLEGENNSNRVQSNQTIYTATFEIPFTSPVLNYSGLSDYINNLFANPNVFINGNSEVNINGQNSFLYENVKVIISEDEFENLHFDEYKNVSDDHKKVKECTICTDSFQENDNVLFTECKHVFHKECIKQWLCHESVKCPICREEICKGHPNYE